MDATYCICIRTRRGIYGQIYPFAWKKFQREVLKAKGYIWLYIPSWVLIQTLYHLNNHCPVSPRHVDDDGSLLLLLAFHPGQVNAKLPCVWNSLLLQRAGLWPLWKQYSVKSMNTVTLALIGLYRTKGQGEKLPEEWCCINGPPRLDGLFVNSASSIWCSVFTLFISCS